MPCRHSPRVLLRKALNVRWSFPADLADLLKNFVLPRFDNLTAMPQGPDEAALAAEAELSAVLRGPEPIFAELFFSFVQLTEDLLTVAGALTEATLSMGGKLCTPNMNNK